MTEGDKEYTSGDRDSCASSGKAEYQKILNRRAFKLTDRVVAAIGAHTKKQFSSANERKCLKEKKNHPQMNADEHRCLEA